MTYPLRRVVPAVLLGAVLAAPASGQETVSWQELVRTTLDENRGLAALALEARAAALAAGVAGALPDPVAQLQLQPLPIYTARGAQRSVWRLEQRVPWTGVRKTRRMVAQMGADALAAEAQGARLDIAYRVRESYLSWAAIQEERAAIDRFLVVLADIEDAASVQYEVGEEPQQSIIKAQIEKNRLRRRRMLLETEAAAFQGELEALSGQSLQNASAGLPEDLPQLTVDTHLLNDDPGLAVLRAMQAGAEADGRLARLEGRPDWVFSLQYVDVADTSIPASADGRDALGIGLGLRIPLSREVYRSKAESRQLASEAFEQREVDRRTTLEAELRAAAEGYAAEIDALRLLEGTLIPQADAALEATTSAYTNGRTDFIDLLDAERTRFELEIERIQSLSRLHRTAARIDRITGRSIPE